MITRKQFIQYVGHEPEHDDLERCNCDKAGSSGHKYCGWCDSCKNPRFICGCQTMLTCPFCASVNILEYEHVSSLECSDCPCMLQDPTMTIDELRSYWMDKYSINNKNILEKMK